ncbi:MAG: hypothetical protein KatS3mg110_0091 [Pirellulaceae bacterium]|nr:MAG: hypothetical protein KatS3mg110_0091 [Pirellulaceae bacterium]
MRWWPVRIATWAGILLLAVAPWLEAEDDWQSGSVDYRVPAGDENVPEPFRLPDHQFPYRMRRIAHQVQSAEVYDVTFPSPVAGDVEENNTVHCEYFLPVRGESSCPAVVVLHILGGDFPLSRLFALTFAERGVAALFVKMPYYGPRRPPGSPRRMISPDPDQTVAGMTQAVLDIRRAVAWLESQPRVDPDRLGIFGISLGGITGALAAECEPRLYNICLVLAGGDIAKVAWESRELAEVRRACEARGITMQQFMERMRVIDPVTYAANLQGRRILMLNAAQDEVIPRACTESLWEAMGKPPIHWYNGGHYSVARFLPHAMARTAEFFEQSAKRPAQTR